MYEYTTCTGEAFHDAMLHGMYEYTTCTGEAFHDAMLHAHDLQQRHLHSDVLLCF